MIDLMDLKAGDRLKLLGGVTAEVIENFGDGQWVRVRTLSAPGPTPAVGTEELCHAQDIAGLLEPDTGSAAAKAD